MRKAILGVAVLGFIAIATFPSFWFSMARLLVGPFERVFGQREPAPRLLFVEPTQNPVRSATRRLMRPLGAVRLLRQIDETQR